MLELWHVFTGTSIFLQNQLSNYEYSSVHLYAGMEAVSLKSQCIHYNNCKIHPNSREPNFKKEKEIRKKLSYRKKEEYARPFGVGTAFKLWFLIVTSPLSAWLWTLKTSVIKSSKLCGCLTHSSRCAESICPSSSSLWPPWSNYYCFSYVYWSISAPEHLRIYFTC